MSDSAEMGGIRNSPFPGAVARVNMAWPHDSTFRVVGYRVPDMSAPLVQALFDLEKRDAAFTGLLNALREVMADWVDGYKPSEVPGTVARVRAAIAAATGEPQP